MLSKHNGNDLYYLHRIFLVQLSSLDRETKLTQEYTEKIIRIIMNRVNRESLKRVRGGQDGHKIHTT